MMKGRKLLCRMTCSLAVLSLSAFAGPVFGAGGSGNGGGGGGELCDANESTATGETGGSGSGSGGSTVDSGPLKDKMSEAGDLYGDLYVILRYQGGEPKLVPAVDGSGEPITTLIDWIDANGNPVACTPSTPAESCVDGVIQVERQQWVNRMAVGGEPVLTQNYVDYTITDEETGEYVINELTGGIYFASPYPSQCVQPVADYERWGDISSITGLADNRLPLTMTYDPTWERTECEVEEEVIFTAGTEWYGNTGDISYTYAMDVYYSDLIDEVDFGRLNLARAPEAVLQASFDEAIRAINRSKEMKMDASGRLVLVTDVYDEFLLDNDGLPLLIETVEKAIDSPKENLALYIKLMRDGHLITPAAERLPIDNSINGGIPDWKKAELEDGPSTALRPTIDIGHMQEFGFGDLVDAGNITTYYTRMNAEGNMTVSTTEPCLSGEEGCEEWYGVPEISDNDHCAGEDFPFAATFFASAADKSGRITMDEVVYLNSILGINKVVGYSAYDEDGNPLPDAINYRENPVYFDYGPYMTPYNRHSTFAGRGQVVTPGGGGNPATYDGTVRVLIEENDDSNQPGQDDQGKTGSGVWKETDVNINDYVFGNGMPQSGNPYTGSDIGGFTTMADDDLRVIEFVHTYQIPGLR